MIIIQAINIINIKEETTMKVLKKELKRKVNSVAVKVAEKTVGRSMPIVIHEPRVPNVLKKIRNV